MNRDIYELARIVHNLDDAALRDMLIELKVNWPSTYWHIINELVDEEE